MTFNIDYNKIKDWEDVCVVEHDDGKSSLAPMTQCLGFACISVGLHEITDKNADEFYARLHLIEQMDGAYLRRTSEDGFESVFLTPQDVNRHIGLHTNAFPSKTRNQWLKEIVGMRVDDDKRDFKKAISSESDD
jgi:hypothetical protein